MSIEAPVPPDTPPAVDAPPVDPYEKRYNDLRPQFDRTAQEAAELRAFKESLTSDPDALRTFLAEQGYEVEDTPEAPSGAEDDRLAAIEQYMREDREERAAAKAQADEQRQLEAIRERVESQFTDIAKTAGVEKVDDKTRKWLEAQALYNLPALPDGTPDVLGAWQALQEWRQAEDAVWAQTKKAPGVPKNGAPGTQVPNLDDDNERRAWMKQQLEARA